MTDKELERIDNLLDALDKISIQYNILYFINGPSLSRIKKDSIGKDKYGKEDIWMNIKVPYLSPKEISCCSAIENIIETIIDKILEDLDAKGY